MAGLVSFGAGNVRDHTDWVRKSAGDAVRVVLKSILVPRGQVSPTHDQKKVASRIAVIRVPRRDVVHLALANKMLERWRSPAFYGDETLKVGQVFDENEAQLAITYAERASSCAYVVRRVTHEQATN
jgi:hypothetical protein